MHALRDPRGVDHHILKSEIWIRYRCKRADGIDNQVPRNWPLCCLVIERSTKRLAILLNQGTNDRPESLRHDLPRQRVRQIITVIALGDPQPNSFGNRSLASSPRAQKCCVEI